MHEFKNGKYGFQNSVNLNHISSNLIPFSRPITHHKSHKSRFQNWYLSRNFRLTAQIGKLSLADRSYILARELYNQRGLKWQIWGMAYLVCTFCSHLAFFENAHLHNGSGIREPHNSVLQRQKLERGETRISGRIPKLKS